MTELLAGLEGGRSWNDAFRDYWEAMLGAPPERWPRVTGCTNWIWLTDLERTDRAVDLGSPFAEMGWHLAADFDEVHYVTGPSLHCDVVRTRCAPLGGRIRVHDERVTADSPAYGRCDFVIFLAVDGWQQRLPSAGGTLANIPRLAGPWLRAGGWLTCMVPNPFYNVRLRRDFDGARRALADHAALRALLEAIRGAGFDEVRSYWIGSAVWAPEVMVPRSRRALRGYLHLRQPERGWRLHRESLLQPFRLPHVMIQARR